MTKDQIIIFNAPAGTEAGLRKAVTDGLRILRRAVKVKGTFKVLLFFKAEREIFTAGESLGPREIIVQLDPKNFLKYAREKRLVALKSTIVHEAVHCLRSEKKIKTVLQALLSEGISCFVQTSLVGPPDYLAFDEVHEEDIRKWWRWWRKSYFKMEKDKDRGFWDAVPQRMAAYRIGYFIVSNYWDANPAPTLDRLIETDFKTLEAFSDKLFATKNRASSG